MRSVLLIAIAAAAGYFVYDAVVAPEGPTTCASAQSACIKTCRRASNEASAAQACQDACQRDAQACAARR